MGFNTFSHSLLTKDEFGTHNFQKNKIFTYNFKQMSAYSNLRMNKSIEVC